MGLQTQAALSEVQEDLRLAPSLSFPPGLQILSEVLAFWEFSAEFTVRHRVYVYGTWYIRSKSLTQSSGFFLDQETMGRAKAVQKYPAPT